MCGICGYVGLVEPPSEAILKGMLNSIYHRGPDDEGIFLDQKIGFGVRRLSIIDLVGGHQPIHNEDESIWVGFNGEIYNFMELRSELIKKGHHFYTNSDTEVLVHLYEDAALSGIELLNGMFGFCIWDKNTSTLLLGRDRIGIKPLYYIQIGNGLIFGSELKAILQHPIVNRKINLESLSKYLTFEYIPTPETIFNDIKKLPPAHYLLWQNGFFSISRYWDISFKEDGSTQTDLFYAEELRRLLTNSVKSHLMSDVPLGVFLSGGIDSSSLVALMSAAEVERVKTFSISFEEHSFDESRYVKEVSNLFNCEHHEQRLSLQKLLDIIPKVAQILDEPLADASIIPTYLLCEFTRRYVTVSLSGDGGDELFAGYPTYQAHQLLQLYMRLPKSLQAALNWIIQGLPVSLENLSLDFKLKKFISGIPYPPEIRHYIWLGSFTPEEKGKLFSPYVKEKLQNNSCFHELEMYLKNAPNNALHKLLYLDMKLYLQDDLLVKVDRASMANSLEVRVPYLENKFVEFVCTLPAELKLKGWKTKYIFKEAMKHILPPEIIMRKKKGFGIPVAKWCQGELKGLLLDVFSESKIDAQGLFNYAYIRRLLEEHFAGYKDNRKLIWTLLIFQLWYERWV